ncbi:MAG: hypothetical protein ACOCRK_08085, partial [bacterium]
MTLLIVTMGACESGSDTIGEIEEDIEEIIVSGSITATKQNDADGTWIKKESDRDDGPSFILNLDFIEYIDDQEIKRVIDDYQYGRTSSYTSGLFLQAAELRENNEKVFVFAWGEDNLFKAAIVSKEDDGEALLDEAREIELSELENFILNVIEESDDVVYGDIETQGQIMKVESDSSKGFHWNYYLYIPESFDPDNDSDYADHMLLVNNYPDISNEPEVFNSSAKKAAQNNKVAEELGIPIIVPAIPRPDDIEGTTEPSQNHFTTRLDRNTLSLHFNDNVDKKYYRLDQQIEYMIDDVLDRLADKDIYLSDQVFTWGYSALGHFTNRFSTLHPERVQASVSGGIAVITLPEFERNDVDLYFPVGVYDLKDLTGKEFNIEAYRDIPQYIFRGKEDYDSEPLAASNTIDDRERDIYEIAVETKAITSELEGTEEARQILIDRINKVEKIYNENNIPAQFRLYEEVGHEMTSEIYDDVIKFLKKNAG